MMVEPLFAARRRRVFESVFQTQLSQPTPYSTPSLRYPEHSQPFGGPLAQTPNKPTELFHGSQLHPVAPENQYASDQTRFDRSWHAVTSRIVLPGSITAEDSFGSVPNSQDVDDAIFASALQDILQPAKRVPLASQTEDIVVWHTHQVRLHFLSHVLPLLAVCDGYDDQAQVLLGSMRTLEAAHRQYLFGLSLIVRGMETQDGARALTKFRRDLHAIVGNSISVALVAALRDVLGKLMRLVLEVPVSPKLTSHEEHAAISQEEIESTRRELLHLVESLFKIGLAGERFQILFAELMDSIMVDFIQKSFAGIWGGGVDPISSSQTFNQQGRMPHCVQELSDWVENKYSRLAVEVTSKLGTVEVSWTDNEKWKEIAVGRLAALRIRELFDIVMSWPKSEGAVDDLRFTVTTPQRRLQLTDALSATLQKRLLHSGRSTLDILRTYIALIRTFHRLDHSRVLLDRVAYSLQLYLCSREDTVRIIVSGLLSSPKEVDSGARKTKLVELVELLYDPSQYRTERQDDDWDDLNWVPAPVDAGSNYKRRKSEDVIGTLMSALGSPEVFIKEFQSIIGERLLSEQVSFEQEIGVLDLLKKRFGEPALQACDVMIKDIQDSRRLDSVIHRDAMRLPENNGRDWAIHTRILSRLFWPDMGEERFLMPTSIVELQKLYEKEFERLKPSRKVKWLDHLGQATVELELEDRKVVEVVHTYEAAVINAFSDESLHGRAPGWSLEELWVKLQIDEDLLTAALDFWESKRVLRRLPDETYVVVERLQDAEVLTAQATKASSNATPADHGSPRKATGGVGGKTGLSEKEKERRQVYWQFVVGMLTNSSQTMPLGQISMMMKMLIPDGFPWSNEELQEFLGEKVSDGELELAGGKYKLVKK